MSNGPLTGPAAAFSVVEHVRTEFMCGMHASAFSGQQWVAFLFGDGTLKAMSSGTMKRCVWLEKEFRADFCW